MNDTFERRIHAAAVAAWWTVIIAAGFLTVQWLFFLSVSKSPPAWIFALWGGGVDWPEIRQIWLWMTAIFKVIIWVSAMIALWLTLWARRLRKI